MWSTGCAYEKKTKKKKAWCTNKIVFWYHSLLFISIKVSLVRGSFDTEVRDDAFKLLDRLPHKPTFIIIESRGHIGSRHTRRVYEALLNMYES